MDHHQLKKLLIEDKISRHKNNISPIKENKDLVNLYNFYYSSSFLFPALSIYFAFLSYTKRHTGRNIYIISTAIFTGIGLFSYSLKKSSKDYLFELWKCKDDEEFENFIDFYTRIKINTNKEDNY